MDTVWIRESDGRVFTNTVPDNGTYVLSGGGLDTARPVMLAGRTSSGTTSVQFAATAMGIVSNIGDAVSVGTSGVMWPDEYSLTGGRSVVVSGLGADATVTIRVFQ